MRTFDEARALALCEELFELVGRVEASPTERDVTVEQAREILDELKRGTPAPRAALSEKRTAILSLLKRFHTENEAPSHAGTVRNRIGSLRMLLMRAYRERGGP